MTADVTRYTRAAFLSGVGKETETFLRFSTVATSSTPGSATLPHCPKGVGGAPIGQPGGGQRLGLGSHTYQWNGAAGEVFWVKYPHADYPPIEIGRLELNRNPRNVFAEVEQSIFSPAHVVPGVGPSPDKMLQGRLVAYGDARRYRVGVNADHLPVNRPHATEAGGPFRADRPLWQATAVSGATGEHPTAVHAEDDDFVQAGNLYRPMSADEQARLVANLAGFLAKVSREDIADRAIGSFRQADEDFGKRLEAAVQALRG